jgi:membrane associated rhomboid family serine protease
MFPIRDLNPTRRFPILTYILLGINVVVFVWQMTLSTTELQQLFQNYAVVPARIMADPFSINSALDVIRSMFFHGGFEHIIGNMLYLYLFGDNIEDRLGGILYVVLYFVSGFVAVAAQVVVDPNSTIPMVGASGAIAGVLGGYLFLYPTVKVQGIVFLGRFATIQKWPAVIVLGLWFVLQLFSGFASLGAEFQGGGVAFFAHIGGFVAGLVLTVLFALVVPQPPKDQRENLLYERQRTGRTF